MCPGKQGTGQNICYGWLANVILNLDTSLPNIKRDEPPIGDMRFRLLKGGWWLIFNLWCVLWKLYRRTSCLRRYSGLRVGCRRQFLCCLFLGAASFIHRVVQYGNVVGQLLSTKLQG